MSTRGKALIVLISLGVLNVCRLEPRSSLSYPLPGSFTGNIGQTKPLSDFLTDTFDSNGWQLFRVDMASDFALIPWSRLNIRSAVEVVLFVDEIVFFTSGDTFDLPPPVPALDSSALLSTLVVFDDQFQNGFSVQDVSGFTSVSTQQANSGSTSLAVNLLPAGFLLLSTGPDMMIAENGGRIEFFILTIADPPLAVFLFDDNFFQGVDISDTGATVQSFVWTLIQVELPVVDFSGTTAGG